MNSVTVKFKNPEYNYSTSVSDITTEQTATNYFVGSFFNVAAFPDETMKQCISIEFKSK